MEPWLYKECLSWLSGTISKQGKIINTGNATAASNITVTATVRFHVWKNSPAAPEAKSSAFTLLVGRQEEHMACKN